jgi:hypothetical protein
VDSLKTNPKSSFLGGTKSVALFRSPLPTAFANLDDLTKNLENRIKSWIFQNRNLAPFHRSLQTWIVLTKCLENPVKCWIFGDRISGRFHPPPGPTPE